MKPQAPLDDLHAYFSGDRLYGDDFSPEEIKAWVEDEKEAYANLGARDRESYEYQYHELNVRHGFAHLGSRTFENALGLGSAYGEEFRPILGRVGALTIVDPSDSFASTDVDGVPCRYVKPSPGGRLPFENGTFDLVVAFGVLHHIPNVSDVVRECARCLRCGGVMLVREPIVSMGDWTKPRPGLTKRERGIPLKIFERIIEAAELRVARKALCDVPVIARLARIFNVAPYNDRALTWADAVLGRALAWNTKYHRTTLPSKIGPASVAFVLIKDRDGSNG